MVPLLACLAHQNKPPLQLKLPVTAQHAPGPNINSTMPLACLHAFECNTSVGSLSRSGGTQQHQTTNTPRLVPHQSPPILNQLTYILLHAVNSQALVTLKFTTNVTPVRLKNFPLIVTLANEDITLLGLPHLPRTHFTLPSQARIPTGQHCELPGQHCELPDRHRELLTS